MFYNENYVEKLEKFILWVKKNRRTKKLLEESSVLLEKPSPDFPRELHRASQKLIPKSLDHSQRKIEQYYIPMDVTFKRFPAFKMAKIARR